VKNSPSDPDDKALIRIEYLNGLVTLNGGQYPAPSDASMSILDESSGNAYANAGNYILTNNNNEPYESAILNNGANLGNSNTNKSLTIDNAFGMSYTSNRSICGFFKLNTQAAGNTAWFSMLFASNPGNYTSVFYDGTKIFINGSGQYYNIILTVGKWYHVAATHDHVNNVTKLYLDGLLVATGASFTGNYSAQVNRFAIGNVVNANYASIVADEIGLWNYILSADEVRDHYISKIIGTSSEYSVGWSWLLQHDTISRQLV